MSFCRSDATQVNEDFGSGFGTAGVPPVILWIYARRDPTGATPALLKPRPAAKKGIIPVPVLSDVARDAR
jgi:hypothetical protein